MNYLKEFVILAVFAAIVILLLKTSALMFIVAVALIYSLCVVVFQALKFAVKNEKYRKFTARFTVPMHSLAVFINVYIYFGLIVFVSLSSFIGLMSYIDSSGYFDENESGWVLVCFFLWLTFTLFSCIILNLPLRRLIYYTSPFRLFNDDVKRRIFRRTDKLLSEKVIRFLIYTLYAVLLVYFNINEHIEIWNPELSLTAGVTLKDFLGIVSASFITFLALDGALIVLQSFSLKPSDLVKRLTKTVVNRKKNSKI